MLYRAVLFCPKQQFKNPTCCFWAYLCISTWIPSHSDRERQSQGVEWKLLPAFTWKGLWYLYIEFTGQNYSLTWLPKW